MSASSTKSIRKLSTKSWSGGASSVPRGRLGRSVGGAWRWHGVPANDQGEQFAGRQAIR